VLDLHQVRLHRSARIGEVLRRDLVVHGDDGGEGTSQVSELRGERKLANALVVGWEGDENLQERRLVRTDGLEKFLARQTKKKEARRAIHIHYRW
jgi:hypothetical protein